MGVSVLHGNSGGPDPRIAFNATIDHLQVIGFRNHLGYVGFGSLPACAAISGFTLETVPQTGWPEQELVPPGILRTVGR
jgi:hypothetical protein